MIPVGRGKGTWGWSGGALEVAHLASDVVYSALSSPPPGNLKGPSLPPSRPLPLPHGSLRSSNVFVHVHYRAELCTLTN